ncbi:Protein O-mannosyltransferase 2 [Mycoemilia scoparia]|uniref:Dolichyl-phosphate-mannose--protein mannosyltransferase n=1 Tax=Mycoemilia scoparia TaxID=417184 RepID=A0A9W8DQN7_9FUNG|nr:Protein O-mannosyltransferase 2 [Mycoemilia scoparia]
MHLGWGKYLWHWVTRLAAFVILPLAIYSACFALHMSIVDETGSGDSRMPSSYQAHIWRNIVLKQPKYVAFGSSVTLRSHQYGVGMMATINVTDIQTLKNNSQVVMNRFKSKENFFFLAKADKSTEPDTEEMPQKYIETSDKFRIFSGDMTLSVLKDKKSPGMSDSWWINLRTSNNTDENDLWDIVNVRQKESNNNLLHTITTEFVIRHLKTGCVLYAPDTEIDGVHEDYSELVCTKNTDALSSRGLLWNIEQVKDHRLERISRKGVPNSFLKNLWHLNGEMARSNNALDVDLEHYEVIESFPYSWPFMLYPMRMNGWEDHNTKYYEIGNPILWWSTAILCLFWLPVKNLVYFICHQRRCANIMPYQRFKEYIWGAKLLWLGWALHYLPFFLMGRVTYIHHYLPALYFALLLLAHELDWAVFSKIKSGAIQCLATLAIATAIGGVFLYFAPFTYGFYGPAEEMKDRQWIPTWNIYYDRYLSL